jgi:hypothetical protein
MTASGAHVDPPASARVLITPVTRLLAAVSQACCRHTYLRRAGKAGLWLECANCGHTTPGVDVATHSRGRCRAFHVVPVCQHH